MLPWIEQLMLCTDKFKMTLCLCLTSSAALAAAAKGEKCGMCLGICEAKLLSPCSPRWTYPENAVLRLDVLYVQWAPGLGPRGTVTGVYGPCVCARKGAEQLACVTANGSCGVEKAAVTF